MTDGQRENGMQARRQARRWVGMVVGAVAAVVLLAAPAAASPPGSSRSAIAFWALDDAQHTRVSVQAGSPATGQEPDSLFLFVTQSYCDTTTDEMVFRTFLGQDPLGPGELRVHPLLTSATLDATTVVSGYEGRVGTCSSPTGSPTFTDLGLSTVEVRVTWTATSDAYEVQPGVTARDAVATGTITGTDLSPGPLGTSQYAQLRSSTT